MTVSILIISLSILFFYFSLRGLGFVFAKFTSVNNFYSNNIYALLSFIFIFIIVTNLHLFIKLSPFINLILLICGFFLYIFLIEKKENLLILLIVLTLVTIQFIGHKVNEDFGYYHLPYVVNFISDKIILGLSHLSMVQGYNSAWLNVSAFFYLPVVLETSVHFINSSIFFLILVFYLNFLSNKKNIIDFPLSCLYALIAISFFIIKNSRLNSFGVDVPGHIYASLVFFLFLNFYEKKDYNFRKFTFNLICLISVFSILIKLSYIPLILFPIICLFLEKKLLNLKIIIIIFFLSFPWIIQQIAYTSCFIFPVEFTCFEKLPWYSKNLINDASFSLEYINKSYWVYNGSLSEEEYIKNFNWVSTWLDRNFIELIENIISFILPLVLLIFLTFYKKNKKNHKINRIFILILCIPIIFGFCLWFLKAPVVRYGIFYINAIIFILFMIIFNQSLLTKFNRVFIIIILTIAITFNISKNLIRVFAEKDYKEFPFPVIEKIKYDTKIYNQLKLNTPISQGHIQSGVCWDTPVYCRTNTFDDLNIEKKRGYIIFTKKNN